MSGHSKWSTIKRKKGATDAKRGKVFTKLTKEITVAARLGGGDPDGNPRLRLAIQAAKAQSMPNDNIHRAIKKGSGDLDGGSIEELTYEGYGPGGVAYIVEVATDNTNRSLNNVRMILDKAGGKMAKSGAVAFMFDKKGMVRYDAAKHPEDEVLEAALDAGADDVVTEGEEVIVYTDPTEFHAVTEGLEGAGLVAEQAEFTMIPSTTVEIDSAEGARKVLRLVDRLEDDDDVQNVWGNFEIPDEVLAELEED